MTEETKEKIYSLEIGGNAEKILAIDGKGMICPFSSGIAIPVQTALGGKNIAIQYKSCNNLCPHFDIDKDLVKITCGTNIIKTFKITETKNI